MFRPSTNITHGYLVRIADGEIRDKLVFQFNPTEVEREVTPVWRRPPYPGSFLGPAQFVRFDPRTVTFTLMFYGRGGTGVESDLARLELFVSPGPRFSLNDTFAVSPGTAKIVLGSISGDVVINSLGETRKMFDNKLQVTHAEVKVTLSLISRGPASEVAYLNSLRKRGKVND